MSDVPDIEMHPVESSNVESIGYHPETKTLAVKFKSGGLYHHADVPQSVYDAFASADSKGKHYGAHVKGRFSHVKADK